MATEYLNNKRLEDILGRHQKSKKEKNKYKIIVETLTDDIARKKSRNIDVSVDVEKLKEYKELHNKAILDFNSCDTEITTAFYTLAENIVRYTKFNLLDPADSVQECV